MPVVCFMLSNLYWSTMSDTVLLKHRTNWDSASGAVRSITWSTILKLADPIGAFDWAIGEVIGRLVPTTVLHCGSGDQKWFAAGKHMMISRLHIVPGAEYAVQFIGVDLCFLMLRPKGSTVLQGSHIIMHQGYSKHSTCSCKWWETLKDSTFGVKPIPACRGMGGLAVAPAEIPSLLSS